MQHDAHVRTSREVRTVFFAEMRDGGSIHLCASRGIPFDKMAWATLRMIEGKRMDLDGSWREDLARLEAISDVRLKCRGE